MKKKINKKILLLILLFPLFISAKECDRVAHEEYLDLAPNITYDRNYSKSNSSFSIIIYNIFDGMYINYSKRTYNPDNENKVTIDNIPEGTNVTIDIYANDGCSQIKQINLKLPYFNQYYGEAECRGYGTKIAECSAQFTTSKVTLKIVQEAKHNYDDGRYQFHPKEEVEEDNSLFKKIKAFIEEWGIKILLAVVTFFVSSTIYNAKFRKIKHGI